MKLPIFLFATLGYPGSGKTYFSERFSQEIGAVHLNADKFRLEMFEKPIYTWEEHQRVFTAMDNKCKELLESGQSVIYDANHNKRAKRKILMDMAGKAGAEYVLLYFKTPIEIAIERNALRENDITEEQKKLYRNIDESVIHRMKRNIEPPTPDEPTVEIDGLADYEEQVELVRVIYDRRDL